MLIRSTHHVKVKKWKDMLSGAVKDPEVFFCDQYRVIRRAFDLGLLKEVMVQKDSPAEEHYREAGSAKITLITEEVRLAIGIKNHRLALIKKPQVQMPADMKRVLLLDNLKDPVVFGSLVRTSRCFGFEGIFLTGDSLDPWDIRALRVAQANIFDVPVQKTPFQEAIRILRKQEMTLVTAGNKKGISPEMLTVPKRLALLFSGNGSGCISLEAISDVVCSPSLPVYEPALSESAAAVMMYTCREGV